MQVLMVDSTPALAALRLYLYCSKRADDPTMTLWSTLVVTQLQIFAAHTCTISFLITKRMSGMVSNFGLGIQTISPGLTTTDRSRGDTSSAEPARRQRGASVEASSVDDATWEDGESQKGILRTTRYDVTHHRMETGGRNDSANREVF
jgi:hypothetical protein